jgi:hypothetical protein
VKDFANKFNFHENFLPVFRFWIHIQMASESGSTFQKENFRENFRENKKFRKNKKICANEKRKKNFPKISRNMKMKMFVSTSFMLGL